LQIFCFRPNGHIAGYGTNGWLAIAVTLLGLAWVSPVKDADEPPVSQPSGGEPTGHQAEAEA
jgi:hypothetical protein